MSANDIETINKNLFDHRENPLGNYERPVSAQVIESVVSGDKGLGFRAILRKDEQVFTDILVKSVSQKCVLILHRTR